jgi:UDP-N-acetylglucosamine 2-epimerase (non-hydrolysing)
VEGLELPVSAPPATRGLNAVPFVSRQGRRAKVLSVFGTRPELIKFYPVLRELKMRANVRPVTVFTSQHVDLVHPLLEMWNIRVDHDLDAMVAGQSLNNLIARLLGRLDTVLATEAPDIVLVQGDTASAMAAAMAAWHRKIPVGHIEAGLRSGMRDSPFPEEMNRRLVTSMTSLHFAPTRRNVQALLTEGVPADSIHQTGNPIVDAVSMIQGRMAPSEAVRPLLERLNDRRILLVTTHRRESFGDVMQQRLRVLRRFVDERSDVTLLFPVHPNPEVRRLAEHELGGAANIELLAPLCYPDFLHCLAASWLIVSDSGGIQEEAPSLGKPLLIIRPNTERPEVVEAKVARLVGDDPRDLWNALIEAEAPGSWASRIHPVANPFGAGDSAKRIVDATLTFLRGRSGAPTLVAQGRSVDG